MKCVLDDKVDCPLDLSDLTEYGEQILEAIELIAGMMPNSFTGSSDCDSCSQLKRSDALTVAKLLLCSGFVLVKTKVGVTGVTGGKND